MNFDSLLYSVIKYNDNVDDLAVIKKAYDLAYKCHFGQFRESGEPYIVHPLSVAIILSELHADTDTICAGLLHDTIEDTNLTKDDIEREFNKDVANLVDGVTKISKLNYSNKIERNNANTRKIITSLMNDVRIIVIKLADRLHNMRTLEHKKENKQKENSLETLQIYTPLANSIGAYRIKTELEDISFKYLMPDKFKKYEEIKYNLEEKSKNSLTDMIMEINGVLSSNDIENIIKIRTKNLYRLYYDVEEQYKKISEIHDLITLKILVKEIKDCYVSLGLVHSIYKPTNEFKDYICNPKANMYRSLHSTLIGPESRLVQAQIRTYDMDKVASFGLTTYWDQAKGNARDIMQKKFKEKFQCYKSLREIDKSFINNEEFVNQVKEELFGKKVYVYTPIGEIIELPKGSTVVDYAYKIHTELGNTMEEAFVNDEIVSFDYTLKSNDRIKIIKNSNISPSEDWIKYAHTTKAKRNILSQISH